MPATIDADRPHITAVGVDWAVPAEVASELAAQGFHVTSKDRSRGGGVHGLRVAPHVYNTEAEIEAFVAALAALRGRGAGSL